MSDSGKKKHRHRHPDRAKWWDQGFNAVNAGNHIRIVPFWEGAGVLEDRIPVVIDPGAAFGLGDHPTTIMALELLEVAMGKLRGISDGLTVLDVGAGVGVLSIASALLGAKSAIAVDIDPIAVNVAKRNCVINKVLADSEGDEGVIHCLGGVDCISGRFDLVMANLVAPLLLRIKGDLCANSKNLLLLSGIFESMLSDVVGAFTEEGFIMLENRTRGEWRSVLFARRRNIQ